MQGCLLAPTLSSLMFSAMLTDAYKDCVASISIRHRSDGKLFNMRSLQTVTKLKETVIRDILFADDYVLNARSEQEMELEVDRLSTASFVRGCVWAAQEDSLGQERDSPWNQTQSLRSSTPHHLPVQLRDLDCLQMSRKAADQSHLRCLRTLLNIRWQDKISNS